jgi:exodeoxyribonuclease VII small subunit
MASSKGAPSNGEPAPSFEAALERLRSIVESLERGELTLDESIAQYEEGMRLSKRLTQQLDEAEQRIERLIASEGSAPPTTQPVELELRGGEISEGELPF